MFNLRYLSLRNINRGSRCRTVKSWTNRARIITTNKIEANEELLEQGIDQVMEPGFRDM